MLTTALIQLQVAAALVIGIFISSPIGMAVSDGVQIAVASGKVPHSMATNATTAAAVATDSSNITLGTPQFLGTEYDKTTSLKPAIVNGTHGFQVDYTGNGVLNGVNVTDNGKGFITNRSNGVIYSKGEGVWITNNGSDGRATYNFQGIGQYGADGKLRDIITDLQTKATGKLAFLGKVIVIDKNEIDKDGNAITKYWQLK